MKYPSHNDFKKKALAKPGVKAAYDALEDEFALINEMIHARKAANKSQAEIAKTMKTTTSAISRLESLSIQNHHSPSLSTLLRYAEALGCKLRISLIPKRKQIRVN